MSGPESMKPDDQLLEEFLAGEGAVRTVYLDASQQMAPAHLDAAILQAAARPAPRACRARWQTPMAAAAVMVLSFGVFLQVQRDPVVQNEVRALPDQPTYVAAPAAIETKADIDKTEVLAEAAPKPEAAEADGKRSTATAAMPRSAPPIEKPRAAPADAAPKPAPPPPPPSMAMAEARVAAAALESSESERVAKAADAAAFSAVAGAVARESMQRQEKIAAASVPRSEASRIQGNAAITQAEPAASLREREPDAAALPSPSLAECPALKPGQVPVIASAAAALAAARHPLIQRFTAVYLANYEPFDSELRGQRWHVYGSLPAGAVGGVPEAEVCQSTGDVLRLHQSQ